MEKMKVQAAENKTKRKNFSLCTTTEAEVMKAIKKALAVKTVLPIVNVPQFNSIL